MFFDQVKQPAWVVNFIEENKRMKSPLKEAL